LGAYKDISYRYNSKKLSINFIISKLRKYIFYVEDDSEFLEEEEEFIATDFEISYELDIDFEINKIKFVSYHIKNLKSNKSILEFKIDEYLNLEGTPIAEYNSRIIQILHLIIRELEYLKNYKFKTQKNLYKKVLKIAQELEIKLQTKDLQESREYKTAYREAWKKYLYQINKLIDEGKRVQTKILAENVGVNTRNTRKNIQKLIAKGLISIDGEHNNRTILLTEKGKEESKKNYPYIYK